MLAQWPPKASGQEETADKADVMAPPHVSPEAASVLKAGSCALEPETSRSPQGERWGSFLLPSPML